MYSAKFITFSGMTIPLKQNMSRDEAKEFAAKRKRYYRNLGFDVSYLGQRRWEFVDDNAMMIGDNQGYLILNKVR